VSTCRRSFLTAFAGLTASSQLFAGPSQPLRASTHRAKLSLYNSATAPDLISRKALQKPLRSVFESAAGVTPQLAIHLNFPQLVEQSLARQNSQLLERWIDQMTEVDLSRLARVYTNSLASTGRSSAALLILANRLDGRRLLRLAPHFGSEPLVMAVAAAAPQKIDAILPWLVAAPAPQPGAALPSRRAGVPDTSPLYFQYLDYTLEEIYLSFRTAPIGALSVRASLFATGSIAGAALYGGYDLGFTGGTLLVETLRYMGAWDIVVDSLGAWLYRFDQLRTTPPLPPIRSPEEQIGQLQQDGFINVFGVDGDLFSAYAELGGDYGETIQWASNDVPPPPGYGGGGGCWGHPNCADLLPARGRNQ
jgi:hypothetical protein